MNNINLTFIGIILCLPAIAYLILLAVSWFQSRSKNEESDVHETQIMLEPDPALDGF